MPWGLAPSCHGTGMEFREHPWVSAPPPQLLSCSSQDLMSATVCISLAASGEPRILLSPLPCVPHEHEGASHELLLSWFGLLLL